MKTTQTICPIYLTLIEHFESLLKFLPYTTFMLNGYDFGISNDTPKTVSTFDCLSEEMNSIFHSGSYLYIQELLQQFHR
jgi:hypothetical protein